MDWEKIINYPRTDKGQDPKYTSTQLTGREKYNPILNISKCFLKEEILIVNSFIEMLLSISNLQKI